MNAKPFTGRITLAPGTYRQERLAITARGGQPAGETYPFQGQAMTAGSLQHELGRLGPACAAIDVPVAPMPLVKQVAPVEPLHGWLRFTRRHNGLGPVSNS